ncbi:MAG TPA: RNA polymerase sigma factor [Rhodocyclaceae bacterium]|nr:RNA polymerase sigma factor [Rhodocyclaceae bacterium]
MRRLAGFTRIFNLASRAELSAFLEGVERRAFKHAVFALRDDDMALDAVQDAMLKLSVSYGDRPAQEFPMLFQRILQNVLHDAMRRQKVRNRWTSLFSTLFADDGDDDPLDILAAADGSLLGAPPHEAYERARVMAAIEHEIARLPARQREAFLMRYWEELDIAETAAAMGCSEGSVKTHCSRATKTLAAALKARGIVL